MTDSKPYRHYVSKEQIAESKACFRTLIKQTKICDGCWGIIGKDRYGRLCANCERRLAKRPKV